MPFSTLDVWCIWFDVYPLFVDVVMGKVSSTKVNVDISVQLSLVANSNDFVESTEEVNGLLESVVSGTLKVVVGIIGSVNPVDIS